MENGVILYKIYVKKGVIIQADDIGRHMEVSPPAQTHIYICSGNFYHKDEIISTFLVTNYTSAGTALLNVMIKNIFNIYKMQRRREK